MTFIVIVLCVGFVVYRFAFNRQKAPDEAPYDLSSYFMVGTSGLPDPSNPCVVLQEYLELTRRESYERAYEYLCAGLKQEVSLEEFMVNSKKNSLLFRDVEQYDFSSYRVDGTAASAGGYIEYLPGGRSRVEAAFAKEEGDWRIALVTVVYQ